MEYSKDLELQLQQADSTSNAQSETQEWTTAFNTSILSTRLNPEKDRGLEIAEIIESPEYACLLLAAKNLSEMMGLSKEESTERIITTFRKMDRAWKQFLIQRGIESVTKSSE